MIHRLTIILLALALLNCSNPPPKNKSKETDTLAKITRKPKTNFKTDVELAQAWSLFRKAILLNDVKTIKKLSANCIYCPDCLTNTPKEDSAWKAYENSHPESWYDDLNNDFSYVRIEKFIKQDLLLIFDESIKTRFLDSNRIGIFNYEQNKELYDKSCIIKHSQLQSAKLKEVVVLIVDPSAQTEGMQAGFSFIKAKNGYKFCGYSTIP